MQAQLQVPAASGGPSALPRRGGKFLRRYFIVLGILSAIAIIPGAPIMVLIFTSMALPLFGTPGLLVIAAPTILLYSAALVPLGRELTAPRRRLWRLAAAAILPVAVTVLPGLLSQQEAARFAALASRDDVVGAAAARPRRIEIAADGQSGLFAHGQAAGDERAPCEALCRRLLFNGEADRVRMTRIPDLHNNRRGGAARSVTYRLERRTSCPDAYKAGTGVEAAVRDRLVAGECLVWDAADPAAAEARATFITSYSARQYKAPAPKSGPRVGQLASVKELRIEEGDRGTVVRRTETVVDTVALPLYFGVEMDMQGGRNGPTVGRTRIVINPVDVADALRATFGYALNPISAPPGEDARAVAGRILDLPPSAGLSAQQQEVLHDVLAAIKAGRAPTDEDLAFMRRIIADPRVDDSRIGVVLGDLIHRHPARTEALIPVILGRMMTPLPDAIGHYLSALGWSLQWFPAESLRPHRQQMLAVAGLHTTWQGHGVLARLAEVGDQDAVRLVVARLDLPSTRKFAALAACRAAADAWPALEPAVLAQLRAGKAAARLADHQPPLLLALVRFGRAGLAAELLEQRNPPDKTRILERLQGLTERFPPERCRRSL